MFKELISGLSKFFNRKELVFAVIALLLAAALLSYSGSKSFNLDGMEDGGEANPYVTTNDLAKQPTVRESPAQHYVPTEEQKQMIVADTPAGYQSKDINTPTELMPSQGSEWTSYAGTTPDLLAAGYHIGIDTIGQSRGIPNYDLRAVPFIEKANVGPWMQSTVEPDRQGIVM
jgi:hypothetical protein